MGSCEARGGSSCRRRGRCEWRTAGHRNSLEVKLCSGDHRKYLPLGFRKMLSLGTFYTIITSRKAKNPKRKPSWILNASTSTRSTWSYIRNLQCPRCMTPSSFERRMQDIYMALFISSRGTMRSEHEYCGARKGSLLCRRFSTLET